MKMILSDYDKWENNHHRIASKTYAREVRHIVIITYPCSQHFMRSHSSIANVPETRRIHLDMDE